MQYRREIDGLRAVAVLPVILFHAGMEFWSGGFVGVDVFFVISGYLITTILIEERLQGRYSVLGFYERRARRILPALFMVLLVCIPFAWAWIPPYPLEDFARSLAFAALFISNIHFLEHGGYFALGAEMRPLLHTWSLAVEEQYYLLFPLVLMALGRFSRRKYLLGFGCLALVSLAVAEWGWRNYPNQNFYFTPSRLWELLAGSICAVLLWRRQPPASDLLAGLGLGLIVAATVMFNKAIPFPSVWTLVPVLGTCLIILFAEGRTWTARLLSWRPLVGIGLISYSAYLWHQPIFVFARIRSVGEVPEWAMLGLAGLSLALAWASWRFIEQPFRGRAARLLPGRAAMLRTSAAGIVALAALGFWVLWKEGYPSRLDLGASPFLTRLYHQTTDEKRFQLCGVKDEKAREPLCRAFEAEDPKRRIALLGDSHAGAILPAFKLVAETFDAEVLAGYTPGCAPLKDVYWVRGGRAGRACHDNMLRRLAAIEEAAGEIDTVVLSARWSWHSTGDYDGPHSGAPLTEVEGKSYVSQAEWRAAFEAGLRRSFETLTGAGVRVVVLLQVPQQKVIPGILVQSAMLLGLDETTARAWFRSSFVGRADHEWLQAPGRAIIERLAKRYGVTVVNFDDFFADGDRFAWLKGDDALYRDDDHLSYVGAMAIAPIIVEALRP